MQSSSQRSLLDQVQILWSLTSKEDAHPHQQVSQTSNNQAQGGQNGCLFTMVLDKEGSRIATSNCKSEKAKTH
ncbi:hypothetical protein FGO68_gene4918 [Halteria grandinella]|uniref:Uncharacterized protein n=1 Tax=Halteria grandinella TaxID=5974 RepID=A0A8J8T675_HALGN|nr:hypothetical protein FGO68_gene4918 [Halteria grandinella]